MLVLQEHCQSERAVTTIYAMHAYYEQNKAKLRSLRLGDNRGSATIKACSIGNICDKENMVISAISCLTNNTTSERRGPHLQSLRKNPKFSISLS